MNNFSEMVNRAIYEIKDALEHGYNFRKDFLEETNWTEICDWCEFPDIQYSMSIYERAINTAIFIIAVEQGIEYNIIKRYIHDNIFECWNGPSIFTADNI